MSAEQKPTVSELRDAFHRYTRRLALRDRCARRADEAWRDYQQLCSRAAARDLLDWRDNAS